ncbi:MAG TPA: polymer-forming cytoskeletal protein [Firmicutes bacterium]|nr:polymer-forming cytoskeletal protein [Bacillota bacterium]
MKKKKLFLFVFVGLIFVFFCGGEPVAAAWQTLTGSEILIREGEVITGDLWVMGNGVKIAGQVKGDLLIFADDLEVSGKVDGDLLGVTGRTVISGVVTGDVRGLSAFMQIDGVVGGNLSAAGTQLVVGPQSKVGSLLSWYTATRLSGEIAGSALAKGNIFSLDGKVGGDLEVGAKQIVAGKNAVVNGDFIYPAGAEPVLMPGAYVGGQRRTAAQMAGSAMTGVKGIWFLGSLLMGLLWLLFFPRRWKEILSTGFVWSRVIGFGFVGFFFLPVMAVLAMLTLVGLPLGIGLFLLFLILMFFGELPVYLLAGRWFCRLFRKTSRLHPAFLFLVGGFVFTFLKLIPVLGFYLALGGRILGNGLLLTYLFWREKPGKVLPLQV